MKILFLPLPSGKPWNGATIYNEPLGGSEAAVAYMARAFARLGHHVTVYTHGGPGVFDNVLYKQYGQGMPPIDPATDVIIVSRWIEMLQNLPSGKWIQALWIHDMPGPEVGGTLNCHLVLCISAFQALQWRLTGKGSYVTGDGVDTSVFAYKPDRTINKNKLVWLSNPDRGLPIAARIFKELRKRWPELELHVYGRSAVYGWDSATERPFLPVPSMMDGVVLHDPLPRANLAREIGDAFCMFYPEWWPEVFCMAALEAQALGIPVLAPPSGALIETVQGGILGWDFLNMFSQLRNPSKYAKVVETGVEFAKKYEWENVAGGWADIFEEHMTP